MSAEVRAATRERETTQVVAWLERHFGGRVLVISRQPRWRPVWFARVEAGGVEHALCVRGERVDAEIGFSLSDEGRFQELLFDHGLPVARVHGWIEEPHAYVMDVVPGQNDFAGTSDEDRRAVMDAYIDALVQMHALDPEPFARAGVLRASSPDGAGRVGIERYETFYRKRKKRPDPFLEFVIGWLRRNPLDTEGREAPITWDSGQFHHEQGRLTGMLDLELGHIGDPLMDLAGFRMRDSIIGYGEFPRMYERYAERTGVPVDLEAVRHHHLAFTLTNQFAFHAALAEPVPGSDFMTNMQWCSETNLYAVETLAEIHGIELADVDAPDVWESPAAVGHAHLIDWLRNFEAPEEVERNEVRTAFRLARHLARSAEIGREVVEADLDDLESLLGERPGSWQAGDAALESFVGRDDGRNDTALVRLFHRRLWRYKHLVGPAGSAMARHIPLQPFDL